MASSSSSPHQIQEVNAFNGIEPASKRWNPSKSSRLFDVFINHRGPDVKQTLAIQLYVSLKQLGIQAFLDSQEKELGISFPSTIKTAIHSAKVHIAIFSRRYAESPWCLAELVHMLESKTKIIPVFYEVEPWELRHIERGQYAAAFIKYEEKGRYLEKLSEWKEALQSLSFIAGEEYHSDCEKIIAAVQKEVQRKRCLHVAKYPVGLNNLVKDFERRCLHELVEDFENQCSLQERKHKSNIVGIFGMGGIGKTTLAKELFNRKRSNYSRVSFLFDVREASVRSELPSLQSQLLKDLFHEEQSFRSIEEGISHLNDCLQRIVFSKFLIVLDDIDHVEQLDALTIMDILAKSSNSLAIVTTRDVGVVITAGITVGYPLRAMDRNHGRELFCWHAFGQPHPCPGYEVLVDEFVQVCGGLPLSLQVLGRHVHGRVLSYWQSELTKARTMLPRDVMQRLRISFDSLDDEEKQVFMDIACFFVGKQKKIAKRVWEGSRWNTQHALETLKDKCLVHETKFGGEIVLRMHDHLRDLGREMALEVSPPHRLWRRKDLKSLEPMGFQTILTKTNIRCFHSFFDESMSSQVTFFLGQSDSCVEMSASLLWLQIEGNSTELPSIPSWIPLQKLQFLKIERGRLERLWGNAMQAPSQLKELQIFNTFLKEIPDFSGISENLENVLLDARKLPITRLPLVEYLNMNLCSSCFQSFILKGQHVSTKRGERTLRESSVAVNFKFNEVNWNNGAMPCSVRARMSGLETLEIRDEECVSKILISGMHYPSLQSVELHSMKKLVEVELRMVKTLNCLVITNCKNLKSVSGISDLAKLVELKIHDCGKLENGIQMPSKFKCLQISQVILKEFPDFSGISDTLRNVLLDAQGMPITGMSCAVRAPMGDLKKLEISGEECVSKILISGMQYPSLQSIKLHNMRKLARVDLRMVRTLNFLEITHCKKLKCVSGISDLQNILHLKIVECGKLEYESFCLRSMQYLKRLTFDRNGMVKSFEIDGCPNLKTVLYDEKLVELRIRGCPEFKKMPIFRGTNYLERIIIDGCGIQDLRFYSWQNLRSVSASFQFTEVHIYRCPELEELSSLARLSCLGRIVIDSCEKVENISGIEELRISEWMRLSYCSNALIRNCVYKLKSVPSMGMVMIGRAADGVESSLNENMFCVDGVIEIGADETYPKCSELSFVIGCFMVSVDSSTSVGYINHSLLNVHGYGLKVCHGEWIITMVTRNHLNNNPAVRKTEFLLKRHGIMKKGFQVAVKKGEEEKVMRMLYTLVDRLYHL